MIDLERDLAAEYESALEAAIPPSSVDLDQARSRGRRLRLRRQALTFGSAIGAAGLAVLLVATVLPGTQNGGGITQSANRNESPGAPPAHDPMATSVTFGWLPAGVHIIGAYAEYDPSYYGSSGGTLVAQGAGWTFLARQGGGPWSLPPGVKSSGNPPGVKPHWPPTITLKVAGGQSVMLWTNAPTETADPAEQAVMARVAAHISVGRYRALPMPFHVPQPPTGWSALGATWGDYLGDLRAPDIASMTLQNDDHNIIAVEVREAGVVEDWDALVPGIGNRGPSKTLTKHDVNGFDVRITATGPQALAVIQSAGGIENYYRSITVHSTDPSTWTTDVVG